MSSTAPLAPTTGWMRSAVWDVALLAMGWLPFYGWLLTTSWIGGGARSITDVQANLPVALAFVLALNFAHRHLVLVMVYGDPIAFANRPRAYRIAPVVALVVVLLAVSLRLHGMMDVMLGILAIWNVWHVVKQRYGLLRIYAARAGGGLGTRAAARSDAWLLWSAVVATACTVLAFRRATFDVHPRAQQVLAVALDWLGARSLLGLALAALANLALAGAWWTRVQMRAQPAWRAPQAVFLASTFALLAVFVAHGPVVGYLVFGVAHSVEYLAFVYHFGARKYAGRTTSTAAMLLGRVSRAPLLIAPLLLAYVFLHERRFSLAFVTYFSTTSALHYLYDGWIWRIRDPQVAQPLAIGRP